MAFVLFLFILFLVLLLCRTTPNQLSHTSQGTIFFVDSKFSLVLPVNNGVAFGSRYFTWVSNIIIMFQPGDSPTCDHTNEVPGHGESPKAPAATKMVVYLFVCLFLLLFKYSCLHFPTTSFHHPTHPHLPPQFCPPPFGFVHESFIHVP